MSRLLTRDNVLLTLIVVPPVLLLFWVRQHVANIPYWDEWDETSLIVAFHRGALHFSDLWAQHSDHRVLTLRLTMLGLDAILHRWDPVSEICVSLAAAAATLAGLIVLAFRSLSPLRALVLGFLISCSIFSISQFENWIWGFQVAWSYVNLCFVWTVVLLTTDHHRRACFFGAIALGAIATISMSSGPLVWICGAVAIAFIDRKDRWNRLGVWLACAGLSGYVYTLGFTPTNLSRVPVSPTDWVAYAVSYLASPLVGWLHEPGSTLAGLLVVAFSATAVVVVLREPDRERAERSIPWIALILFAFGGAGITALGRASLGLETALSSRYVAIGQFAWIGLLGISMIYSSELLKRGRIVAAVIGVVVAISFLVEQWTLYPDMVVVASRLDDAREQLLAGNATDDVLRFIYPVASVERGYIEALRQVGDGPLGQTP